MNVTDLHVGLTALAFDTCSGTCLQAVRDPTAPGGLRCLRAALTRSQSRLDQLQGSRKGRLR